jgi:hypothetical protein
LRHFRFANLVKLGDEDQPWDELIRVLDSKDRANNNLPSVPYYTKGDASFDKAAVLVDVGEECASQGVWWGDINGDGLDNLICLDKVSQSK